MTRTHQLSPLRCAKLKKGAIPPSAVEVIGVLPPVDSVTGYQVTPVVGIIPPDLPYRASEGEVSAVFEMPLARRHIWVVIIL